MNRARRFPVLAVYAAAAGESGSAWLKSPQELHAFLVARLYEAELRIFTRRGRVIFSAIGGIDMLCELAPYGIDLPEVYAEIRRSWQAAAGPQEEDGLQPWEAVYDAIGLSLQETAMRRQAKHAAQAARTVADVAQLCAGTYFSAFFESEDGRRAWGYFDPRTLQATVLTGSQETGWQGDWENLVTLDPAARVRHTGSGEDIHGFILLDPPER